MQIELNGKLHPLPDGATLEQLIAALELTGKAVAVAVNRQVVPAQSWAGRALVDADRVDVVRAIGGG
ncbi:sulfur carrier protein ThiS [Herbaspirillum robiniae]|uniref:Sulfur carrier protein ThiS n=1 Tax=Herbaspirillum robiniae TaxID=2014887 RepID=A0A246WNW0_9BURK|nr:sulfur carrier protein ThiS [Herbaspirillum robiniae]NUU02043.1 sulfur carrier protein ThiS [Herbaspirillum robiniae]OWY27241.1 thiamine biosynthesis protein ThiS [Herbaspirillum robiniae]